MQPGMVEALERAGINTRLLTEPDPRLEVSVFDAGLFLIFSVLPYLLLYKKIENNKL